MVSLSPEVQAKIVDALSLALVTLITGLFALIPVIINRRTNAQPHIETTVDMATEATGSVRIVTTGLDPEIVKFMSTTARKFAELECSFAIVAESYLEYAEWHSKGANPPPPMPDERSVLLSKKFVLARTAREGDHTYV